MVYLGAFSAQAMAGLVWFVQVVHYPLFTEVGRGAWSSYHAEHERRTGWVVAPLMIVELVSAAVIVARGGHGTLAIVGLALAALTWILTFLRAVPLHRRLGQGYDAAAVRSLLMVNWLRTIVWTAHGAIALVLLQG